MLLLKQSTAVTVKLGPFIDDTDGKTAETALTLSQADFRLSKNGGDFAQKNEANSATHDEIGYYDVALDTTDTNTLGRLRVCVHESGALPVWADFMVVPANVYDSIVGGTDNLQVDTVQVGGTSQTARDIGASVLLSSGTGTGQLDFTSGVVKTNVTQFGGSAGTFSSGRPEVNTTHLAGTSQTARDIGASVLLSSGTGTGQISLNSGAVSLHTTQGAITFTSITCTGAWTVSDGIIVTTSTSGRSGINVTGNGTGHGMYLKSGTGATGNGLYAQSQATNGHGILGTATGTTGNGIYGYGGTTNGNGIKGQGGDTSGYGIEATATNSSAIHALAITSGHGFEITATGSSKDAIKLTPGSGGYGINGTVLSVATVTGNVDGSVGSVTGAVGSVTGNVGGNVVGSVASVTGNVGGNVTGSVGSVSGNVGGNVTGSVGSVVGNVGGNVVGSVASVAGNVDGNVTGSVGSVATGGITSASFAADSITASAIATDAGTELANALLDLSNGIEASVTLRQAMRAMAAMLAGTVSGGGTGTETFKSIGGSTTRVTATVESDGDRTEMTLDL